MYALIIYISQEAGIQISERSSVYYTEFMSENTPRKKPLLPQKRVITTSYI
jgi:hypothetical protein